MKPWEKYQPAEQSAKPWEKYGGQQVEQSPEKLGLLDQLAADMQMRKEQMRVAKEETAAGRQSEGEKEIQQLGAIAGGAGDIMGNIMGAAASGIGKIIPEQYKRPVVEKAQELAASPVGQSVLGALGAGMQKYGEFAEESPRAARNIEAVANIGLLGAPALKRGEKLAESTAGVGRAIAGKFAPVEKMTSEQLREIGSNLFKQAEAQGGILKPSITNKFIENISKNAPQTYAGRILAGDNEVTSLLGRVQQLQNRPLTLDAAKEIDEILGELAYKDMDMGKVSAEGKKFLDMQSEFRRLVENATDADVVGGKAGFDAIKEARKYWAASLRLRDIERIIERAENMQVPATGIKTGFRNLVDNKNKLKGYTPEEQEAIRRAAETGVLTDLAAVFGSRLGALGAGAAGFASGGLMTGLGAGLASWAGSSALRNIATRSQLNKARIVEDLIRQRVGQAGAKEVKLTPAIINELKEIGITTIPAGGASEVLKMLEEMRNSANIEQGEQQ